MIIHDTIEQGTEEWFAIKSGKPSTSNFSKMMSNGRGTDSMGVTALGYAKQLAAERELGFSFSGQGFRSDSMERGNLFEPDARAYFNKTMFQNVVEIGGIENFECFASTDGLPDDAVLEIKCPEYPNHLKYLFDHGALIDKDYKWQLQGELWISERETAYVMSYHPDFQDKQVITTVERDEEMIDQLINRRELFEATIKEYQYKLQSL